MIPILPFPPLPWKSSFSLFFTMYSLAAGILSANFFLSCSNVKGGSGILFGSPISSSNWFSILILGFTLSLQTMLPLMCATLVGITSMQGIFVYSDSLNPSSTIRPRCCRSPLGSRTVIVDLSAKGRVFSATHVLSQP